MSSAKMVCYTPQPKQRSAEWLQYRHEIITSSDTAKALDYNPHQSVEKGTMAAKCEYRTSFDSEHAFC